MITVEQRLAELDRYAASWRDREVRMYAEGRGEDGELAGGWARMVEREAAKLRLRSEPGSVTVET